MKKGVDSLVSTIQNFASSLTKTLFTKSVEKFLEAETIPVKINYIDWWPRSCQKVREFVSKFCERRVEGATATTAPITASFLHSGRHSFLDTFWNLAETTTTSALEHLGFKDHLGVGKAYATMFTLPSAIGLGTALALKSYDVLSNTLIKTAFLKQNRFFTKHFKLNSMKS